MAKCCMSVRSEAKQSVRNNPVNSKPQKERGVLQVPEQIFPCCPWERPWRSRDCPAACGENTTAKGIHTAASR